MSKINKLHLKEQRNDKHFQYHTEFLAILAMAGFAAVKAKIAGLYDKYAALYERVDAALKKVTASVLTNQIKDADNARDEMYSGMVAINTACLNHYDPAVREAAERLKILFRTYGNVSAKPINEQTSAVYNILQELTGAYADAVASVGIKGWVDELDARNKAFDSLVKQRDAESTGKVDIVLRDARTELDGVYRQIIEKINALVIVESAEQYEEFIKAVNVVIARYGKKSGKPKGKGGRGGGDDDNSETENGDTDVGGSGDE